MVGYYWPISRCATRLWAPKRDCPDSGEKRLAGFLTVGAFVSNSKLSAVGTRSL